MSFFVKLFFILTKIRREKKQLIFFQPKIFSFLKTMKTSPSKSKDLTSSGLNLNTDSQEIMSASLAEEKFIRSNMTSQNQEFYRNMKRFSRELSKRKNFIRHLRSNSKRLSYHEIPPKCNSLSNSTFRNLPKISPKILNMAIEMKVLKEDDLKGLILNPNKYSVFFEQQDLGSPFTRNAMKNLGFKPELIIFPHFTVCFPLNSFSKLLFIGF